MDIRKHFVTSQQQRRSEQNRLEALKRLNSRSKLYQLLRRDTLLCILSFVALEQWPEVAQSCIFFAEILQSVPSTSVFYKQQVVIQTASWPSALIVPKTGPATPIEGSVNSKGTFALENGRVRRITADHFTLVDRYLKNEWLCANCEQPCSDRVTGITYPEIDKEEEEDNKGLRQYALVQQMIKESEDVHIDEEDGWADEPTFYFCSSCGPDAVKGVWIVYGMGYRADD